MSPRFDALRMEPQSPQVLTKESTRRASPERPERPSAVRDRVVNAPIHYAGSPRRAGFHGPARDAHLQNNIIFPQEFANSTAERPSENVGGDLPPVEKHPNISAPPSRRRNREKSAENRGKSNVVGRPIVHSSPQSAPQRPPGLTGKVAHI